MMNCKNEIKPAIVVLAYNRVKSLNRLLKALNAAVYEFNDVPLIISVDCGTDDANREVLSTANAFVWKHGEKTVRTFSENQGLREHFLQCGDYSVLHGAAIMLEDDVFPAPFFYLYVTQALNYYKDEKRILAISLYSQSWNGYANRPFIPINQGKDVYISQIECSWGECYIGERWKEFREWYAVNKDCLKERSDIPRQILSWKNSYSKYIIHYFMEYGKYYVTPYLSLSTNFGEAGVHFKKNETIYQVPMMHGKKEYTFADFDGSIKYDIFFENINLCRKLEKKYNGKVCLDFYGLRKEYSGFSYLLSAQALPYRIIKTYGLEMRPWEENIYNETEGEGIYLYDLKTHEKNRWKATRRFRLLQYQLYGLGWREALYYAVFRLKSRL